MDNPPSTKDPICSREDVSADISASGQSFAPAGMKASLVYVCNLCRPEMTPFRNINVLENLGSLVGTQENYICFNWVCFTLKSLSSATESPVRASSVTLCRYGKDLYRIGELSVG